MIKVGVNENVYLAQVEQATNEEGKVSLVLGFAEVGAEASNNKSNNPLDMLNSGSDSSGDSNITKQVLFPPNTKYLSDDKNGKYKQNDPRPGKEVFDDFLVLKNQASHILVRYMPEKSIKWDLLAGINLTGKKPEEILAAFSQDKIRDFVFKNFCTQFAAQAAPLLNDQSKPSRLFLIRSSAANHFGTLRKRFLERTPFWEDMNKAIGSGKDDSKMYVVAKKGTTKQFEPIEVDGVKYVPNFNAYELSKGLDSDLPVSSEEEEAVAGVDLEEAQAGLSPTLFTIGEDENAQGTDGLNF